MLSYVLPVEDKPSPIVNRNHLQLDLNVQQEGQASLNGTVNGISTLDNMAPTTIQNFINVEQSHKSSSNCKKVIKTHGKLTYATPAISTESSASSLSSKASEGTCSLTQGGGGTTPTGSEKLKPKLMQNGSTKTTSLKRVSFGSSKGSMVETLIYENPLQEESEVATPTAEIFYPFSAEGDNITGSDSKKVRVTFFESERPLVVHSPEPEDVILDILDAPNVMTSISPTSIHTQYQRQTSTDSGWDNPFRPDGDLSREADEIVGLIKEGKPITPTPRNGAVKTAVDESDAVSAQVKGQLTGAPSSSQKGFNGTTNCDKPGVVEVQRTVVTPSAGGDVEPVVIKKKPKCKCCVIQ